MNDQNIKQFETLKLLYSSRSAELNNKGLLSYIIWIVFIMSSLTFFILHDFSSESGLSIYITTYPLFLLVWSSFIIYIHYKIRLLWIYLEKVEIQLYKEIFNSEQNNELERTENIFNTYRVPLWAVINKRDLTKTQYWSTTSLRRTIVSTIVLILSILIWFPTSKGYYYLLYSGDLGFNNQILSVLYFAFILLSYIILITIMREFNKRLSLADVTNFFTTEKING